MLSSPLNSTNYNYPHHFNKDQNAGSTRYTNHDQESYDIERFQAKYKNRS